MSIKIEVVKRIKNGIQQPIIVELIQGRNDEYFIEVELKELPQLIKRLIDITKIE